MVNGKCEDYVVVSQDTVTVAVETESWTAGRAQEENNTNIVIIPDKYLHSSKYNSKSKNKMVESSNTYVSSPGLNFQVSLS